APTPAPPLAGVAIATTGPRRSRARPATAAVPPPSHPQDQPQPAPAPGPTVDQAEDLLADSRIVEACAHGEAVVRRSSDLPAAWELLGRCYTRLGDLDKARACYTRYLELAPTARNAAFVRAILKRRAH